MTRPRDGVDAAPVVLEGALLVKARGTEGVDDETCDV
jgi:hypothetical protein